MTAESPRSDHALRRMLLAAVLLFAQLVSPTVALGMLQAPGPMTVCRADGTVQTMPGPDQHDTCAVCPACHAPSPVWAGPLPALAPPALHADQAAAPATASDPFHPLRIDARPRGPPSSII